ncbi:F-box domain containing protein [Tanacetum coccineum]
MEDDMLKAQIKVVDILCELELIYPPALFDIMVHLVIHLPIEALEGGPIHPRWMYPFERYMKKLKGYVRNKAKPKGSIVEGYVAEEALTFSSHYFWDVTMKFNLPDRNLKKVKCYVLHNSPEIDTYRSQYKSVPNKDIARRIPTVLGRRQRSVPLYYPSWEKVPKERKAAIISEIGTEISEGINMHLQKSYNTNKASFKAKYWKAYLTTRSYDVEAIRRARPEEITAAEWDKYIKFWNDPKNLARAAQNRLNRQKSVVTSRQGSRSLARLRDEMRQASDTQEYPSLIDTFWRTHTVDGVFPKDEDRRIYEEMKRLEATGEYTEDEINALARGGKLRGHIPGVGRVLPSRATSRPSMPAPDKSLKSMHRKVDFMMSLFRSDSKYSDMFKEFESGGASGSGGCGDDEESGDDEDGDGDD